jgi:hypothetical protein
MSSKPGEKGGFYLGFDAVSRGGIIVGVGCQDGGVGVEMCQSCVGDDSGKMMGIIECRR